jgi:hypothetical protein
MHTTESIDLIFYAESVNFNMHMTLIFYIFMASKTITGVVLKTKGCMSGNGTLTTSSLNIAFELTVNGACTRLFMTFMN